MTAREGEYEGEGEEKDHYAYDDQIGYRDGEPAPLDERGCRNWRICDA